MSVKKITVPEIGDMLLPITLKVRWINNGGCGIFAVALYKELIKYGFKPKLLTLTSKGAYEDTINEYKNSHLPTLRNNRKNNSPIRFGAKSHYMVKLGNFALDCSGSFTIKTDKKGIRSIDKLMYSYDILGTISIDDLEYLNQFAWAWNSTFDRTDKKKIEGLVKKQLAKILN